MVLPSFLPLPPFPPCFATNVCPCLCPLYCHDTKWQLRGQGQGQTSMAKHGGNGGKGKNDTTEAKIGQIYQFWGQGQNLDRQDTTDTNVRAKPSLARVKDGDLSVKIMLTQWGLHSNCLQCKRLSLKLSLFVSLIWRGLRGGDGIYFGYGDHFETFWNLFLFSYYTNEAT